jgi:hypothetical protein
MWSESRFTCSVGCRFASIFLALLLCSACSPQSGDDTSDTLVPPNDDIAGEITSESDNSGCVRCHTDKELLKQLTPPREVEEEAGGGG